MSDLYLIVGAHESAKKLTGFHCLPLPSPAGIFFIIIIIVKKNAYTRGMITRKKTPSITIVLYLKKQKYK